MYLAGRLGIQDGSFRPAALFVASYSVFLSQKSARYAKLLSKLARESVAAFVTTLCKQHRKTTFRCHALASSFYTHLRQILQDSSQCQLKFARSFVRMSVAHYDVLDCRPTIILRSRKQFRDAMALIRTCRQLYQEGHRIVISCTLFHIWTRHPFYRPLKSNLRKEITMIHLAAQLSSQHTSKIATAIRDLDDMPSLRDIYLSIWDFIDFTNNSDAVTRVFELRRLRLKDLCLVQVNLICPRTMNQTAERDLKSLIMTASRSWPTNKEFGILRSLQGPVTKWRAFIRLSGYRTMRTVGADEDLVAVPWDGEHL